MLTPTWLTTIYLYSDLEMDWNSTQTGIPNAGILREKEVKYTNIAGEDTVHSSDGILCGEENWVLIVVSGYLQQLILM